LASIIPLLAAARTPQAVKALQPELEGLQKKLPAAIDETNRTTATLGAPGIVSQGMKEPNTLEAVTEYLSTLPAGAKIREILSKQLEAAQSKGRELIDRFGGSPRTQETTNMVGKTVNDAVNKPINAWHADQQTAWDQAAHVQMTPDSTQAIIKALEEGRAGSGLSELDPKAAGFNRTAKKLDELNKGSLPQQVESKLLDADGKPMMQEIPGKPVRAVEVRNLGKAGGKDAQQTVDDILSMQFPEVNKAMMAELQPKGVTEMAGSQLPALRGGQGAPNMSTFTRMMHDPDVPADQIKFIGAKLNAENPAAFKAIVKEHMERLWDEHMGEIRNPQQGAGHFALDAGGKKGNMQRDKMLAAAEASGVNPQEAADILDALMTSAHSRAGLGRTDTKEFERLAGQNPVSSALRIPGLAVGGSPAAATIDRMVSTKAYSKVVEMLTNPEEAHKLAEFIRFQPAAQKGEAMLTFAMGLYGMDSKKPERQRGMEVH
jgi:hypothetical protein